MFLIFIIFSEIVYYTQCMKIVDLVFLWDWETNFITNQTNNKIKNVIFEQQIIDVV